MFNGSPVRSYLAEILPISINFVKYKSVEMGPFIRNEISVVIRPGSARDWRRVSVQKENCDRRVNAQARRREYGIINKINGAEKNHLFLCGADTDNQPVFLRRFCPTFCEARNVILVIIIMNKNEAADAYSCILHRKHYIYKRIK